MRMRSTSYFLIATPLALERVEDRPVDRPSCEFDKIEANKGWSKHNGHCCP